MDFDSILSQPRRRGHRNIPGEYPGPQFFRFDSLAFGLVIDLLGTHSKIGLDPPL